VHVELEYKREQEHEVVFLVMHVVLDVLDMQRKLKPVLAKLYAVK